MELAVPASALAGAVVLAGAVRPTGASGVTLAAAPATWAAGWEEGPPGQEFLRAVLRTVSCPP